MISDREGRPVDREAVSSRRPRAFLPDDEATRVREILRQPQRDPELATWTARLLDDRAARSALIQDVARQLHHARRRLRQATQYLDGLIATTHAATREPWPQKLLCPSCGAPVDQVIADWRPNEQRHHVIVHVHVDGRRCEAAAESVAPLDSPE